MTDYTPVSTPPTPGAYERPGMVTAIAIMTIVSGAMNIMYALGITAAIVLGTIGIGIICAPITILPGILAIFEIIYGVNLLSVPPKPTQPSQVIAILEICCALTLNIIPLVVGILALVFYGDPKVKEYFTRINTRPIE